MSAVDRRTLLSKALKLPLLATILGKRALAAAASAVPDPAQKDIYEFKFLAVRILRVINTAQAWHKHNNGSYAEIAALFESQTMADLRSKFHTIVEFTDSFHSNLHYADAEIVPGWELKLQLTDSGDGYIARMIDVSGATQTAFSTDQLGVIYEGQTLETAGSPASLPANAQLAINSPQVINSGPRPLSTKIRSLLLSIAMIPTPECPCYGLCWQYPCCCPLCCGGNQYCALGYCVCCLNCGCSPFVWCCVSE